MIHDDDHLRIIHQPGEGPYLLITFGDLTMPVDGLRFCADGPVDKLGVPCVGIMPKWPHWYPSDIVRAALPALQPVLAQYGERIIYGGSMGGHGAVKHSGMLDGTATLAMCPQWSIDPVECGFRAGWGEHLGPHNAGMGIRPEDGGGRIYVFVDPREPRDQRHAAKITGNVVAARQIDVPWVGHGVTRALAGTKNLSGLIEAARAGDMPALLRHATRARRAGDFRMRPLVLAARQRHPAMVRHLLEARSGTSRLARILLQDLEGTKGE